MKKADKNEVLEFLANLPGKPSEQFNQGFALLQKTEGKNLNQERHLNKGGFTMTNLGTVLHELQKLHRIKDSEIKNFGKESVSSHDLMIAAVEKFKAAFAVLDSSIKLPILFLIKIKDFAIEFALTDELIAYQGLGLENAVKFEKDNPGVFSELKNLGPINFSELLKAEVETAEFPEEIAAGILILKNSLPIAQTPLDLEVVQAEIVKVFEAAPDEVKNEIKFRDEFPFVNDPNLPAELKILVTDKFNHYHAYADAQSELTSRLVPVEGKTPEEQKEISNAEVFVLAKKAIENFVADQAIRDEFVHYKEHGTVLGKHPIFKERVLQEKVNQMTMAEAAKRVTLLENYVRRDSVKAEKATSPEDKLKCDEKVVEWKSELVLVNLKLGNSAAK